MSIRVIIVEDYTLVRVGVVSILRKSPDIEVIAQAETAEEGLDLIQQHTPDVVLMDLGLPGMNGIEATRQIKQWNQSIKVIVLTSHDDEEEVLAALGSGANGYFLKDNVSELLIHVVQEVSKGAAWLDPKIAQAALDMFQPTRGAVSTETATEIKEQLTPRELEILKLLVLGKTNAAIAEELHLSVHTIKVQVTHILEKLSVNDRVQAAVKAVRSGIA